MQLKWQTEALSRKPASTGAERKSPWTKCRRAVSRRLPARAMAELQVQTHALRDADRAFVVFGGVSARFNPSYPLSLCAVRVRLQTERLLSEVNEDLMLIAMVTGCRDVSRRSASNLEVVKEIFARRDRTRVLIQAVSNGGGALVQSDGAGAVRPRRGPSPLPS